MRIASTLAVSIAALVASAAVAQACPNYNIRSPFGGVTLTEGFLPDPWTRNLTAGGTEYLAACGFSAQGWLAAAPDYEVGYNTTGRSTLSFYVQSNYDTFLLINGPNGQWYFSDDDFGNLQPVISFYGASSGVYDVWVGSYNQGRGLPATLYVTERF